MQFSKSGSGSADEIDSFAGILKVNDDCSRLMKLKLYFVLGGDNVECLVHDMIPLLVKMLPLMIEFPFLLTSNEQK